MNYIPASPERAAGHRGAELDPGWDQHAEDTLLKSFLVRSLLFSRSGFTSLNLIKGKLTDVIYASVGARGQIGTARSGRRRAGWLLSACAWLWAAASERLPESTDAS